jgi:hypothetical protein
MDETKLSRSSDTSSPVFILSCARSGSTLLRYIVDTHPAICCPGELNLGSLCDHLYWAIHDTIGQAVKASNEAERERVALNEVRRIVSEFMSSYAITKGKRIWCEKTPMNLVYCDVLSEVFPKARYLCLHRRCLDVVHSCLEFSHNRYIGELAPYFEKYPNDRVSAMISYWVDRELMLLDFEQRNKSSLFRIKYEDIVQNPAKSLGPMFDFLGVEWDSSLLNSVFTSPHDRGDGDPKALSAKEINPNSIGKGAAMDLASVPGILLRKADAVLRRLDYPGLEFPPGLSLASETAADRAG